MKKEKNHFEEKKNTTATVQQQQKTKVDLDSNTKWGREGRGFYDRMNTEGR